MKRKPKKKREEKDETGLRYCFICDEYCGPDDDACPSCGNPVGGQPEASGNAAGESQAGQ
ncbi:MAG: hypothetical protein HYX24_04480 [Candidatus Aenigmarchaeota archaeon]|nr:hypothetical protein [Candidatus Aenigmarchaeota archaeon]